MTAADTPLLSAPAAIEQRAFRALLEAMSRPGTLSRLPEARPEDGRWGAALVALQALLDHEVTFHVAAADPYPRERLLRRTGAHAVELVSADFVLTDGDAALTAVRGAREGAFESPETGATVVLCCRSLDAGDLRLSLSGPGIAGRTSLALDGVTADVFRALSTRTAKFPEGIDMVLVDEAGQVAALPRSTRIAVGSEGE